VKTSEWTALCERERERGGEVIALSLTNPSAQEMAADAMLSRGIGTFSAVRIDAVSNLAAEGREVEFATGADADTVTVRDADGQTRVVALACA
jgi:hypothetical protein